MNIDIKTLHKLCEDKKIKWTVHCLKRMRERDITYDDYVSCIHSGEIIENYPNDRPLPSCLVSGYTKDKKHLHDVVGCDNNYIYAITAYYPNLAEWENDYKTRKGK